MNQDVQGSYLPTFTVLDGGLGTQLFHHGVPRSDEIWSAHAIADPKYHDIVVKAHKEFIEAGAEVITTANYAIMPYYYMKYFGPSVYAEKIKEHTLIAVQLARRAIKESGKKVLLYGCLCPSRESLRPDLTSEFLNSDWNWEMTQIFYRQIASIMEPFVDAFILETMNTQIELECCLFALEGKINKPIAISMQGSFFDPVTMVSKPYMCEHIAQFIIHLVERKRFDIIMYSLNCAPPQHISASLACLTPQTKARLRKHGIQLGAYANGTTTEIFENVQFETGNISAEREKMCDHIDANYINYVRDWIELGVTCVGGCCKIAPHNIRKVCQVITEEREKQKNALSDLNFSKL